MSHASKASITLGGASPQSPPANNYQTPSPAAGGGRPQVIGSTKSPDPTPSPTTSGGAGPQYPWRQQGRGGRERRQRDTVPEHHRTGGPDTGMASVYTPKPQTTSTSAPSHMRDDVMQQAQFHVQPVATSPANASDVKYGYSGQTGRWDVGDGSDPHASLANHPGVTAPPIEVDQRRSQEAREKLAQLKLSPQAIEMYKRRFNVLDLNKDGVVNLREFAAISRVLGYKFTKEEILSIFGRRDIDDSGGISFDEFVLAMYERASKSKELAPFRAKFREYDWRDTGYITTDEAGPVLYRELGFDENKTEGFLDKFDKNRDYRLSLLEFVDFYKKVEELKAKVVKSFREFDRNGDGFVDTYELKQATQPRQFSDEQIAGIIHKYDKDGDGKLNYSEFAAFYDVPMN